MSKWVGSHLCAAIDLELQTGDSVRGLSVSACHCRPIRCLCLGVVKQILIDFFNVKRVQENLVHDWRAQVEPLVRLTLAEAMGEAEGGPGRGLSLSQFSALLTSGDTGLALYDPRTGRQRSARILPPPEIAEKPAGACAACLVC